MGTARRDGYVAKAVNAQRTGTATLEQERGGERGREGGSLQTDQSALSAAESWTDEQCGETDRGAREGGGARRRMETPSSLSAVTVVQMGATLLS